MRFPRVTVWFLGTACVLALMGASSDSCAGTDSSSGSGSASDAQAWIDHHGHDATTVATAVAAVRVMVSAGQTDADLVSIAQGAQQAHDLLDQVRNDFAESDGGKLGDAELDAFAGANDLKNAMGALVAYAGDSNPATLAHFTTQFANARAEWNHGVRAIWHLAGEHNAPSV